jgi:outer membrane immunogenic protein
MQRTLCAAVVLAGLGMPALAADLGQPYTTTAAAEPPAWTWTGCYAGGQLGGLWGQSDKWIVRTPGGAHHGQSLGNHQVDGVMGGFQFGCDYAFRGIVAGVQADFGRANADGRHDSAQEFGVTYKSDVEWIASVTGRIGRPFGRLLPYIKGGVAWERDSYGASTIITGTAYKATETHPGWTAGIGGEYAISRALSVFLEYDYYDFGTNKIRMKPQLDGLGPAFVDIEDTANIVKTGLNIRF